MREQAIAQKVGNRSGVGAGKRASAAQRPARRRGNESIAARLRGLSAYLPTLLKLVLAIGIGLAFFAGYRAAASASFFQIRQVEVQGTARASVEDVQATIRREVSRTGVWNADLKELNEKLQHLPWIRSAIISRVLPDGIRVRISERVPRVVVRTSAGRFRWVDEDAVFLGEMSSVDPMPVFFLRGLSEDESESVRKENVERVRRFLELQRDCAAAGISERVSEVNLLDLRDMRAQLGGDDSQIEIRLGSQDAGKRLKYGLEVLDTQRQTPRGQFISYVDLSQGKRAVIGFSSGAHATASGEQATAASSEAATTPMVTERTQTSDPSSTRQEQKKDSEKGTSRKEKNKQESARRNER